MIRHSARRRESHGNDSLSDYAALPRGWLRGLRAGPPHFTLILFRNSLRKTINGLDNPDPR
jgi:hypothetical protein